ncbi:TetR/AcrR family transcriptional regulator [Aeromicrobium stalagmiti]|uniref:TetR/AcrR family transcriptional regulator n=1 Tax=Aeromicrobium stalagmiti TaxID=2738988 RepID=UPI00156838CB|nr:TetR/AcrR family transcriptional regulator [Aeromicrobium stalagmiti]NRQ51715.1 TetR/AcrR family transcriptional regulator [Aeromicrobium stalagmiti]
MPKESTARERLLATAGDIFYREGIHAVGVDRLVSEAGVTRATFYRYFPSKDELVRAYLESEDVALRELFASAGAAVDDPAELLELVLQGIAADVSQHHTRGCPFINAAAEFPDAAHPVRVAVRTHRDWFEATLVEVVKAAGIAAPESVAHSLVLLRDAALVGSYLDGPDVVVPSFVETARTVAGISA